MPTSVRRGMIPAPEHISPISAGAERPLSTGTLDAWPSDITELIRVGRDDARSHSLPLTVMERRGTASARSALATHGTGLGRTLRAPNGGTRKTVGAPSAWKSGPTERLLPLLPLTPAEVVQAVRRRCA